jgi:hypothetical protein
MERSGKIMTYAVIFVTVSAGITMLSIMPAVIKTCY